MSGFQTGKNNINYKHGLYKDKDHNNKLSRERRKDKPYLYLLKSIRQRCEDSNSQAYKYYGGRNIKCLITTEEITKLWFRDKAYDMEKPSIDRKDNDGNYEYSNCQFMERPDNKSKDWKKPIQQYDLNDKFIKEWDSMVEASLELNIVRTNICKVLKKKRISAGGYKWEYKL